MVSRVPCVWSLLIEAADLSQSTLIIFSKGSCRGLPAFSVYFTQASVRIITVGLRQGVTGLLSPCSSFLVPPSSCSVNYILNFLLCPACKEQQPPPTTAHAVPWSCWVLSPQHAVLQIIGIKVKMVITKRMVSLEVTLNLTFTIWFLSV